MPSDALEIVTLAHAYREACENVQTVWVEVLESCNTTDDKYETLRAECRGRYSQAVQLAQQAREKLLESASGGVLEVGQWS
jgi:hypothetical protein